MLTFEIKRCYHALRPSEKKVADYCLANPQYIAEQTVVQIAEAAQVSTPTVLRFIKALGFDGYRQFQVHWEKERERHQPFEPLYGFQLSEETKLSEVPANTTATVIRNLEKMLQNISTSAYEKAVKLLVEAQQIELYGVENSAATVSDLANKLLYLGLPCRYFADSYLQQISAGHVTPNTLAIGISYTGSSKDTHQAIMTAKKQGAKTIVITNTQNTPIAQYADVLLCAGESDKLIYGNAIFSRATQMAVVDMLYMGIILTDYQNFTKRLDQSGSFIRERGL